MELSQNCHEQKKEILMTTFDPDVNSFEMLV